MSLGGSEADVRHFLIPLFMFGLRQSQGTVNIIKQGRKEGRSSGTHMGRVVGSCTEMEDAAARVWYLGLLIQYR